MGFEWKGFMTQRTKTSRKSLSERSRLRSFLCHYGFRGSASEVISLAADHSGDPAMVNKIH